MAMKATVSGVMGGCSSRNGSRRGRGAGRRHHGQAVRRGRRRGGARASVRERDRLG
jgi:hypothetical protein